jgi:hypothetical protein
MDSTFEDLLPSQILEEFIAEDSEWTLPLLTDYNWEQFELSVLE